MHSQFDELMGQLKTETMPEHIAIIMDGNGRWAKKRFLPRTMGHRAGMDVLKNIVQTCVDIGVPILTVYAFSTENWRRPQEEVRFLMNLLVEYIARELLEMSKNGIKINVLGDYRELPEECVKQIDRALDTTRDNQRMHFNIALNYGARTEMVQAVRKIGADLLAGRIDIDSIDQGTIEKYLYTALLPDPDLLIRTAGEKRISNFMLWQCAYTEFWVTDVYWPDFKREHLIQAIIDYQGRERRYGGLSKRK